MANLQHLIAALGKVADAYAPYAPDPNDDDDDAGDPNDDSANDDGDPLDDPRSYPDDDDDPDKDADDDGNDFSKPKILSTVMLLKKLENEADLRFRTEWKDRNQEIVRRNVRPPVTPPSKVDQNRDQLLRLKRKTAEIDNELRLEQQVEDEFSDTLKPERDEIADTIKPMQFEDAQVVSVGQTDNEYPLGVGGRLDDTPPLEWKQPSPKHCGVAGNHMYHFQDHHQSNFSLLMVSNTQEACICF